MADNKDKKVLKSSIEREQSQTCLNSAEREKIKGSTNLNVPHLRFPEFSGEWDIYEIGDVLCIGNGRDYKHLSKGDIPVFGTGGYMTSVNECLHEGETTFIGRKGTIDKPFYYNGKFWTVDTLFYTHSFKYVIPKFVYCLFQTINWLRYNEASGVPSLSKDTIEKIKVRIPQLDEQKKITRLLSLIDERIAIQNKIIEDLKLLKSAIIERTYCDRSYHPCRIGDVIEQISERNKGKSIDMVLSVSNKQGFINQSEQFEDRIIASEDTSNYKIVHKNDFAYNPARINVGSIARLTTIEMGIVSPMYICFRVRKGCVSEYLEHFFSTSYFFYEMQKRLEGSVRQCLSFEGICNIPIYIPSSEEQHTIGKKISVLLDKIDVETLYHCKLVEQKHYLLRQMFI